MSTLEDLWTKIENSGLITQNENIESTVLVVGETNSGKSSLIQAYLKPTASKDVKPTVALEYNYARKKVMGLNNQQMTNMVHLWELGGDVGDTKLLEIAMNIKTISNLSVVICCDLSKPNNILASLQKWTKIIRELIKKILTENKMSSKQLLTQNTSYSLYQNHLKDSARSRPCEIPLYFIANKYDLFKALPVLDKRAIFQVIRMFAHYHGASLLTASCTDTSLREQFRSFMDAICFPTISFINTNTTNSNNNTGSSTVEGTPTPPTAEINTNTTDNNTTTSTSITMKITKGISIIYEAILDRPIYISAGKDDFETILLISLMTVTKSKDNGNNVTSDTSSSSSSSSTAVTSKFKLITTENDKSLFLTPQGLSKDCWMRFHEYLKGLFGASDVIMITDTSADDSNATVGSSGNKLTATTTTTTTTNTTTNTENEFPEKEIDDMRAQRDLMLQKYIQEVERREIMRAKMNSTDEEIAQKDAADLNSTGTTSTSSTLKKSRSKAGGVVKSSSSSASANIVGNSSTRSGENVQESKDSQRSSIRK